MSASDFRHFCGHCQQDLSVRGTTFGPTCVRCGRFDWIETRLAPLDKH